MDKHTFSLYLFFIAVNTEHEISYKHVVASSSRNWQLCQGIWPSLFYCL